MTHPALKHTPLFAVHKALGARFVPFAGWEMAVQFQGVIAEHTAVRTKAGIFDVSHMGELVVEGPEAQMALDYLITADLPQLTPHRAVYTLMCMADGGVIDDLIVYCESATRYFLCVNASRVAADYAHLRAHLAKRRCRLMDVSAQWGQLAVQGPDAAALVMSLTQSPIVQMANMDWCDVTLAGIDNVRVARTGYTGESGFELYCPMERLVDLWQALTQAQTKVPWLPCGLASRDSLRLEMRYPLYGQDIDLEHTPLEAGLGWAVKLQNNDFLGRDALLRAKAEGLGRKWVGFEMVGRGIARPGYAICVQHAPHGAATPIGIVTSGTHSPSLNRAIGAGYVPLSHAAIGTPLWIRIREGLIEAKVVKTPFYKRGA